MRWVSTWPGAYRARVAKYNSDDSNNYSKRMKQEYKKRKDENLAQWVERIAAACQGRSLQEVHEMISEVSKQSYIAGVHAEREVSAKFNGRIR